MNATSHSGHHPASLVRTVARAILPPPLRWWIYLRREAWHDARIFRRHVRRTDVFLVGHPKSGNTWLAYMLAILLRKDREGAVTLKGVGRYVPTMHAADSKIATHGDLPDPRVFRNELPLFPKYYPRVLYLMRDPRAVLVSYYHMYRAFFGDAGRSFEDFLQEYLTHGGIRDWYPHERWDRQVLGWLHRAERDPGVTIVRYEDMVRDRRATLEAVARFAGISFGEEDMAGAVARGSFEAMQRDEEEHGAESFTPEQEERGRFVRRGSAVGWKDEMDRRLAEQIEKAFAPAMRKAGYL